MMGIKKQLLTIKVDMQKLDKIKKVKFQSFPLDPFCDKPSDSVLSLGKNMASGAKKENNRLLKRRSLPVS